MDCNGFQPGPYTLAVNLSGHEASHEFPRLHSPSLFYFSFGTSVNMPVALQSETRERDGVYPNAWLRNVRP